MPPLKNRASAIILNAGKILLMHRFNHGAEYFVFPGGGVEDGETVEQAAVREVREETTLSIRVEKLLYHQIYDDTTEQFFFLCTYLSGQPHLDRDTNEFRRMQADPENIYDPNWFEVQNLEHLLVYPLEVRDWLIGDMRNNFRNVPRSATIAWSEVRQTL